MPPDDDRDDDGKDDRGVRKRLEALIPDLVKKGFSAGLGAVLSTEEGIRKLTNDYSLPKDVANYLLNSAQNSKDEIFKIFAREMREFLERMNIAQEIAKVLTLLSFEIKTEIRFIPNDESLIGIKPDVKARVAVKKQGEES